MNQIRKRRSLPQIAQGICQSFRTTPTIGKNNFRMKNLGRTELVVSIFASVFLISCADVRIEMAAYLPVVNSREVVLNHEAYLGRAVQIKGCLSHAGGNWILDNLIKLRPSYLDALKLRQVGDEIVVRGYLQRNPNSSRECPFRLESAYYTQSNDMKSAHKLTSARPWEMLQCRP